MVDFRKEFSFFSFDFRQNFEVRTFSRWLSIRGTKFFWRDIPKFFFFQNVHLGPIGWIPKRIFYGRNLQLKLGFWAIFENYSMRMLSIRGNDFIAHWADEETISSHTGHTPNFRVCSASGKMLTVFICTAMLSIRGNDFIAPWAYEEMMIFKNLVL